MADEPAIVLGSHQVGHSDPFSSYSSGSRFSIAAPPTRPKSVSLAPDTFERVRYTTTTERHPFDGISDPPDNDTSSVESYSGSYDSYETDSKQRPGNRPSSVAKPFNLWHTLETQRRQVHRQRQAMANKRQEIQEIWAKEDSANNALMQILLVLPCLGGKSDVAWSSDDIKRRVAELQVLRQDFQHVFSSYRTMEHELERRDGKLQSTVFMWLRSMNGGSVESGSSGSSDLVSEWSDDSSEQDESIRQTSWGSLLGISGQRKDIHPLYNQLLDRIGDHELAAEHYYELMISREKLLDSIELKMKMRSVRQGQEDGRRREAGSIEASYASKADLQDIKSRLQHLKNDLKDAALSSHDGVAVHFQEPSDSAVSTSELEELYFYWREEVVAEKKLQAIKDQVGRLRTLCIDKGAMPDNVPIQDEYRIRTALGEPKSPHVKETTIWLDDHGRRATEMSHPRFHILRSDPSYVLHGFTARTALLHAYKLPMEDVSRRPLLEKASKEFNIETLLKDTREEDKSDFINRWLLQNLRTSTVEVFLLWAGWYTAAKAVNVRHWQEDVLYFWTQDEAATAPMREDSVSREDYSSVREHPAESARAGLASSRP